MALHQNATKLANLFDPEVIADILDTKLIDAIKFAPLAVINTDLVGNAGDTVTLPKYAYIGDAVVVAEGADIPIRQLTQSTTHVKVQKYGNGCQLTDEACLSGFGDPIGEATTQLAMSIASKADNDLVSALEGNWATQFEAQGSTVTADDISDALALFGEDIDGVKVAMVDATTYAGLRKSNTWLPASEISADIRIKGTVGEVAGCQVMVTNRIKDGHVYIVKPRALAIFMKRDTMIETDRDIINKSTVLTADKHCAIYLLDDSKAITIRKHGEPAKTKPQDDDAQS